MAIGGHIIEVLWLQMWLIIVRTALDDWPARELFIIGRGETDSCHTKISQDRGIMCVWYFWPRRGWLWIAVVDTGGRDRFAVGLGQTLKTGSAASGAMLCG